MRGKTPHLLTLTGLAALLLFPAAVSAQKPAAERDLIDWRTNLQQAQKMAVRTGRPMMIVFRADWCTHCREFEAKTLSNPKMAAFINREFIPVYVDFDKKKRAARILEVKALPCTVILSPKADLLGRVVGAKPPKDFWEALQDAKDKQARIRQARYTSPAP